MTLQGFSKVKILHLGIISGCVINSWHSTGSEAGKGVQVSGSAVTAMFRSRSVSLSLGGGAELNGGPS